MTLSKDDTRYLRASGILLLLGLCLGAATAGWSYQRWQQAQQQHTLVQNQDKEMQQKLSQASREELELKEKIARYLQLKQQGVLGAEKRLDWVEQLALIRRERKLADLQYELSPQHPVEKTLLAAGPDAGGHQFGTSTLRISASLLHEDDLLTLIGDIRQRLSAIISVRACALERRTADERTLALSYALKAECTLELVTLKEPGA